MKVCNGNTWTNTLTFIYIDNVIMTSFIRYFIVTAENLIWLVFLFFCSWWPAEKYLFAALICYLHFSKMDKWQLKGWRGFKIVITEI